MQVELFFAKIWVAFKLGGTVMEKQFIEYVVKQLVDNPDEVKVNRISDDRGVLLELTVAPDDLGRVIGRRGATAQSLRNLLRALGMKNNDHYNLKIIDTDKQPSTTKTEDAESVESVEKNDSETVENSSERVKKLREDLADIDDLDI